MKPPRSALHQILDRREGISPHTREACERAIDRFIQFAGPDPQNWTYAVGQAFYDSLRTQGLRNGARTTMHHLRYISKWHARQANAPDFATVQMHALEESEPKLALAIEETQALLGTCSTKSWLDRRDFTMLVVGLETGMRTQSLRGMTWSKIGKHAVRGYPIATVPIKGRGGNATYDVPLSDVALQVLKHYKPRGADGAVFTGFQRSIGPRGQTILAPNATAITNVAFCKNLKARAERAKIRHVHPHLLRHTFITWRAEAGVPLHHIAAITGHHIEQRMVGAPKWGELPTYLDETIVADEARNTTPTWLVELVNKICEG